MDSEIHYTKHQFVDDQRKKKKNKVLLSLALSLHATHHPLRSSIQQGVSNISYETILEVSATSDTPETL